MGRRTSLLGGGTERALRALCERATPSRALRQALRPKLRQLVDFDAYCVNTCDPESGLVTSSVGDGLSDAHARELFALEAQGSDLNRLRDLYRGPERVVSMWRTTHGAPEQSLRMRRIFMPLGYGDELRAALTVSGGCFGYLHLFRCRAKAPFSLAEQRAIAGVAPSIARALRRSMRRELCEARAFGSSSGDSRPALLLLDSAQQVLQRSADCDDAWFRSDDVGTGSALPHWIADLVSSVRAGRASRALLLVPGAAPSSVTARAMGADTAIIVDELRAREACELIFTLAELTPRERAVSRLIVAGYSNQAIARELELTLHTVKAHVKSLLAKAGCESRAELSARVCRVCDE